MLCSRCNLPIDDHGPEGQCPAPTYHPKEVLVYICRGPRPALAVKVPTDATAAETAREAARALDLDPDSLSYRLIGANDQIIPANTPIRQYRNATLHLDPGALGCR